MPSAFSLNAKADGLEESLEVSWEMNGSLRLYISEIPRREQQGADLGISVYGVEEETGKLVFLEKFPLHTVTNVSFLDRERSLLYVTAEEPDAQKKRAAGDRIVVLNVDRESGKIQAQLDVKPTLSPNPVYVTLDHEKKHMIVANHTTHNAIFKVEKDYNGEWRTRAVYDDATVVLYSLNQDGTINRVEDVAKQEGSGPLRTQTHAHPHSVEISPSGKLLAVCDKGADKVFLYRIEDNQLKLAGEPYSSQPGDEPRFCAFHPTEPYLYANHEGNLGLDVLHYSEEGTLQLVQTVNAEPEGLERCSGQIYEHQGIAMHPSGEYLYSVARGVDAMAAFRIDCTTGMLELMQLMPMNGAWPRCCQLTPDGNWLAAGTRDGGDLILYRVTETGVLEEADRVQHSCGVAYISALRI